MCNGGSDKDEKRKGSENKFRKLMEPQLASHKDKHSRYFIINCSKTKRKPQEQQERNSLLLQ